MIHRSTTKADKQHIHNIARAMIDMQNSHQVGKAMENVTTVSENNMTAVEQVNMLTKEITTQLSNVTEHAKSLMTKAKGEKEMLSKITLAEGMDQ